MKKLRIIVAQLNFTVGDIDQNLQIHLAAIDQARARKADIIVFPELSITGYPPEDLLFREEFIIACDKALETLRLYSKDDMYCLVGHPYREKNKLFNTCTLIYRQEFLAHYKKQRLPNYGVFDEGRYFDRGNETCVVNIKGIKVGLIICEDVWVNKPIQQTKEMGAQIILVPNASPFEINKHEKRLNNLKSRAIQYNLPILYINTVGGQDDIIFDGGSMLITASGELAQFAGFFDEKLIPLDLALSKNDLILTVTKNTIPAKIERVYRALVLSVKDYINKNNFPGVIVGVSGGIDSALTLAIAVDALGPECVRGLIMPSEFTAKMSSEDALSLMQNLKVAAQSISIDAVYQQFLKSLQSTFKNTKPDITEENIQARCRAILLMACSNKWGYLVLTTGNRSELAVGYCTLYGDMAGGFAVLKDIPKTLVYELVRYRNKIKADIPERILTRAPTAELAPNQKDEDLLPPYSILDPILKAYINHQKSIDEIVAAGFDETVVEKVVGLVRKNEYKRRQSPVGPRIDNHAFGKDRRYPITNGFKG